MTDYVLSGKVGYIADAIKRLADSQKAIADAMVEANKIELNKQKREWKRDGLTSDTFNVGN